MNLVPNKKEYVIGIDMASGKYESVGMNINRVQYFSDKAKNALEKNKDLEQRIYQQVNSIMTLAMLSSDVLHIDVAYEANIKEISVKVFDKNTDYLHAHRRKFGLGIYLAQLTTVNTLLALEDKLIELVAEARSNADRA